MYFTTHLLAGAALGTGLHNPLLALPAGLLSHAALDAVPHHDYWRAGSGALDLFCGLGILAGLMAWQARAGTGAALSLLAGAAGGTLPDLELVLAYLGVIGRRLRFPSHSGLVPHPQTSFWRGALNQGAVAALALLLLALA